MFWILFSDTESSLSSQSPCYSPKLTESCVSTGSEMVSNTFLPVLFINVYIMYAFDRTHQYEAWMPKHMEKRVLPNLVLLFGLSKNFTCMSS